MSQALRAPPVSAQSIPSTSSTLVPSRFFAQTAFSPDDNSPTQTLHRVLSPVGASRNIQPIDIMDTSSDSLVASSTSALPPPSTSSGAARFSAGASSRKRDEFDLSSDLIDDAFLDELDKVEQAAIASGIPTSQRDDARTQEHTRENAILQEDDVIVIDDDDDDFESCKENIPVKPTTSRVGRRDVDVIDLSD